MKNELRKDCHKNKQELMLQLNVGIFRIICEYEEFALLMHIKLTVWVVKCKKFFRLRG